jgi:F-type H+-transporting ATPase subunit b
MEEAPHARAVTEVPPAAAHDALGGVVEVTPAMMTLTWVVFALLALVLYKVAWKPILKALEQRERSIRQALEGAEQARAEAAASEARGRELVQAAQQEAHRLVVEAKAAAQEAGRRLHEEAEQRSRQVLDEARRDIAAATEEARTQLRRETTDLAIALAGKVVSHTMDADRNRELVRTLLKEIDAV